jgi:hypothetical protein
MTGFYYHTDGFSEQEIAEKCAKRLDGVPSEFEDVSVNTRAEVTPSEILDSALVEDWVAANYTETIVEFDTPIDELNEKSHEKEVKRLREEKGQFIVVEVEGDAGDETYTVSALIEIRGRVTGGKTEFFVEEFKEGKAGISG